MRTFCTIITSDYSPYAATLYRSVLNFNSDEKMAVLVCDDGDITNLLKDFPKIQIHKLENVFKEYKADELINKYRNNIDALRWSLKSVYVNYLLRNGYDKVLYADCDIFFFDDYEFLFEELDKHSLLLTPSHTTSSPYSHEEEFLSGFQYGQFNAGFFGAGKESEKALKWWANCCSYKVEINFEHGLFVDQKYLDALPVLFENVSIIKHKGCNIAFWNQHECKRTLVNGKVLINEKYPIVFIHFTNKYIPELLNGNDPLIYRFYLIYQELFGRSGTNIKKFIAGMPEYENPSLLVSLKRKLLIRTRIKRWLFKLSQ